MSELAERERVVKRGWAAPGGAHDRVIAILKLALPALIGVVLAFLAFSPLEEKQEVSFTLDKDKAERAEERMRVQSAQYRGVDNRGRPFVLTARAALQQSAARQVVDIAGMSARMDLESGPALLRANRARYDMTREQVDVMGPVLLTAADGYRMQTRDVAVDLKQRRIASRGSVEGRMPLGNFTGGRLEVDIPERRVVLTGRPTLHIVQGGVR